MSARIERWLLIEVTEVLADCHGWSTVEIGEAWLNILSAVALGVEPPADQELTRVLWAGMRARHRTGRRGLPEAIRAAVFARDGKVCRYCGDEAGPFEVDHILAVSRGGTDDLENLCVACCPCNRAKAAKLVAEWIG